MTPSILSGHTDEDRADALGSAVPSLSEEAAEELLDIATAYERLERSIDDAMRLMDREMKNTFSDAFQEGNLHIRLRNFVTANSEDRESKATGASQ